jgi:hypothetical protein
MNISRVVVFALLASFAPITRSQVTSPPAPSSTKTAPNAWMTTTPLAHWDPFAPSIRKLRDQFWDNSAGAEKEPLTPETARNSGVGYNDTIDDHKSRPELPEVANRAVLTGSFMGFTSVPTASGRAIYTDILFGVHDLLQDRTGHASPNSEITVSVIGGTVTNQSGQVISYLTQPREMFLEPGHSYLLVLSYHTDGEFLYSCR